MGADALEAAQRAAAYTGVVLDEAQQAQLERFHDWLGREAIGAGGIGPNEKGRLWSRHIADSLVFGLDLAGAADCLDVGTGVGLPGVPLAIAHPLVAFTLVDRAGRRVDLVRRACRMLGLRNCRILQADVKAVAERFDRLVFRASLSPERAVFHVKRLLRPGGIAYVGLSSSGRQQWNQPLPSPGFLSSVLHVPAEVLDSNPTLLRIEAT